MEIQSLDLAMDRRECRSCMSQDVKSVKELLGGSVLNVSKAELSKLRRESGFDWHPRVCEKIYEKWEIGGRICHLSKRILQETKSVFVKN
jgi:hypothetical protein